MNETSLHYYLSLDLTNGVRELQENEAITLARELGIEIDNCLETKNMSAWESLKYELDNCRGFQIIRTTEGAYNRAFEEYYSG